MADLWIVQYFFSSIVFVLKTIWIAKKHSLVLQVLWWHLVTKLFCCTFLSYRQGNVCGCIKVQILYNLLCFSFVIYSMTLATDLNFVVCDVLRLLHTTHCILDIEVNRVGAFPLIISACCFEWRTAKQTKWRLLLQVHPIKHTTPQGLTSCTCHN